MATKLTFISETHYKDIDENSKETNSALIESYREDDTLEWHFEEFCKFLLASGYSLCGINKYLNYDGGEVWGKDEE